MAASVYEDFPPDASEEQLDYLVQTVKNWSIQHGLSVRPNPAQVTDEINPNHVLATNAPVTLYPSPFPEPCFEQARSLQTIYNELYGAIASDESWLNEIMKETVEVDDFLGNLWKIHLLVKEEGYVQDLSLGMFRSDYMLHHSNETSAPALKQVEFNTISSSFGGLAELVTRMHTELASFPPGTSTSAAYPSHALFGSTSQSTQDIKTIGRPPENHAVETLVSGLAHAHKAYGPSKSNPPLPQCVIFLVQDNERNIFDQLALSSNLHDVHRIPSFRLPTSQILTLTTIPASSENSSRPLIYTSPSGVRYEVTVVYFRALYAPSEYNTPTSWAARHHLERSAAIKCPSILLHLSGSKKIQQVLTTPAPSHLERFLPQHSAETLSNLRSSFAPQYSMSDGPDSEGVRIALDPATAEHHVLKPQREGGGNNIYRGKIPGFLKSIPENDYKQYILMELIKPPAQAKNTVLRSDGMVVSGNVISELGIFGTCVWRHRIQRGSISGTEEPGDTGPARHKTDILFNNEGGYLLRTKAKDSDEGGVAAGFSSLDSVILYE